MIIDAAASPCTKQPGRCCQIGSVAVESMNADEFPNKASSMSLGLSALRTPSAYFQMRYLLPAHEQVHPSSISSNGAYASLNHPRAQDESMTDVVGWNHR